MTPDPIATLLAEFTPYRMLISAIQGATITGPSEGRHVAI